MLNSSVSLLTFVVTAIVVFFFTAAWVKLKNARGGYRVAKTAVGVTRKAMWSAAGALVWSAVVAAILVVVLVAWQARDLADAAENTPSPSPSARPS
ncbi:hypothetical protein [Actinoplanes awajinensis]|uniref:Uncharacterized protein n=1 Tax=Actinoplanes awajinensis subsp. mycoplanecinus TaxID=135947 RepID=A0A0X3V2P6_9ACTN|nr:hypothetical protein [Actinoplanes awajinensis]KUL39043.1 hypothetical protein ADL15_10640 [Actinoplanes awajinensis subsp. mycoplanecinus]